MVSCLVKNLQRLRVAPLYFPHISTYKLITADVCVLALPPCFMSCINVTMHHLCHLLSEQKCEISSLRPNPSQWQEVSASNFCNHQTLTPRAPFDWRFMAPHIISPPKPGHASDLLTPGACAFDGKTNEFLWHWASAFIYLFI